MIDGTGERPEDDDLNHAQLMDLPHGGSAVVDPDGYAAVVNKDDQSPQYRNHPNDPTDSANDYLDWKHHQLPHQKDVADYKTFTRNNPDLHSTGGAPNYDGTLGQAAGRAIHSQAHVPSWTDRARAMYLAQQGVDPDETFGGMTDALHSPSAPGVTDALVRQPPTTSPDDLPADTLAPGWLDRYMSERGRRRAPHQLNFGITMPDTKPYEDNGSVVIEKPHAALDSIDTRNSNVNLSQVAPTPTRWAESAQDQRARMEHDIEVQRQRAERDARLEKLPGAQVDPAAARERFSQDIQAVTTDPFAALAQIRSSATGESLEQAHKRIRAAYSVGQAWDALGVRPSGGAPEPTGKSSARLEKPEPPEHDAYNYLGSGLPKREFLENRWTTMRNRMSEMRGEPIENPVPDAPVPRSVQDEMGTRLERPVARREEQAAPLAHPMQFENTHLEPTGHQAAPPYSTRAAPQAPAHYVAPKGGIADYGASRGIDVHTGDIIGHPGTNDMFEVTGAQRGLQLRRAESLEEMSARRKFGEHNTFSGYPNREWDGTRREDIYSMPKRRLLGEPDRNGIVRPWDRISSDERVKTDVIYDDETRKRKTAEDKVRYYEDYLASHPSASKRESDADYDTPETVADAAAGVPTVHAPKSYTDKMADAIKAEPDLLKKFPSTAESVIDAPTRAASAWDTNRKLEKLDGGDTGGDYKSRAAAALGDWLPKTEEEFNKLPTDKRATLERAQNELFVKGKITTPEYQRAAADSQETTDHRRADEERQKGARLYEMRNQVDPPKISASKLVDPIASSMSSPELAANAAADARAKQASDAIYKKEGVAQSAAYVDPYAKGGRPEDRSIRLFDDSGRVIQPPSGTGDQPGALVVSSGPSAQQGNAQPGGPHVENIAAADLPRTAPFRISDIVRHTLEQGEPIRDEANAMSAESRSVANLQRRIGMAEQQNAAESMHQEADRRARVVALMGDLRQQADAIATQKIDPNHYWADKGAGSKALLVIAAMLGGFAQGLHGGDNPVLKAIDGEIDRDIAAQKTNMMHRKEKLDTTKGQLELMRMQFGDERTAESAVKLSRINSLKAYIEGEKSKHQDPVFQARADAAIAQLNIKADQYGIDLHNYVPAHQAIVGQPGVADAKFYIPKLGAVFFTKEDRDDTVHELAAYEQVHSLLSQIQKLRAKHGELTMEERTRLDSLQNSLHGPLQEIQGFKRLSATDEEVNNNIVGNAKAIVNGTGTDENVKAVQRDMTRGQISRMEWRGAVQGRHGYDPRTGQLQVYYRGKDFHYNDQGGGAPANTGYQSLSQ